MRLILEASQGQIGRSLLGMPSCMSKYRFVGVRISILISKIISGIWRPLEADPKGQSVTDGEVTIRYVFMYI